MINKRIGYFCSNFSLVKWVALTDTRTQFSPNLCIISYMFNFWNLMNKFIP